MRYTWRPLKSLKIFNDCPSDKLDVSKTIFERTLNLPSSPALGIKMKTIIAYSVSRSDLYIQPILDEIIKNKKIDLKVVVMFII